jgi:hypothetical protein
VSLAETATRWSEPAAAEIDHSSGAEMVVSLLVVVGADAPDVLLDEEDDASLDEDVSAGAADVSLDDEEVSLDDEVSAGAVDVSLDEVESAGGAGSPAVESCAENQLSPPFSAGIVAVDSAVSTGGGAVESVGVASVVVAAGAGGTAGAAGSETGMPMPSETTAALANGSFGVAFVAGAAGADCV